MEKVPLLKFKDTIEWETFARHNVSYFRRYYICIQKALPQL